MTSNKFSVTIMEQRFIRQIPIILFIAMLGALTACGGSSSSSSETITVIETVEVEKVAEVEVEKEVPATELVAEVEVEAGAQEEAIEVTGDQTGRSSGAGRTANRLIVKDAQVGLLVNDTDTAINRSLGIVVEYDGYVINNRTWFNDDYKYATLTIGVPVENFEEMLRRLKEIALLVTNETVSGKDVSDEYVDLASRLRNLEATASRIRDFLQDAKDVDKALEVSDRLSEVEVEIEQVKGRMAYLQDRAAFSTITLEIAPQIPTPTPAPTLTPTPTSTPTPTPTPTPSWSAARTFDKASSVATTSARTLFQITVDLLIWGVMVILPCLLPVGAFFWFVPRVMRYLGMIKDQERNNLGN